VARKEGGGGGGTLFAMERRRTRRNRDQPPPGHRHGAKRGTKAEQDEGWGVGVYFCVLWEPFSDPDDPVRGTSDWGRVSMKNTFRERQSREGQHKHTVVTQKEFPICVFPAAPIARGSDPNTKSSPVFRKCDKTHAPSFLRFITETYHACHDSRQRAEVCARVAHGAGCLSV